MDSNEPILVLMPGDCLELFPEIPDKSIDLILCDLPYGTTKCKWDVVISFEELWKAYSRIIKPNGVIALFGTEPFSSFVRLSNADFYKHDWIWVKNIPSNISSANYQPMRYSENISIFYYQPPKFNKQMIERSEGGKSRVAAGKKSGVTFKSSSSEVSNLRSETKETSPEKYDTDLKNPSNLIAFNVDKGSKRFHPTQKPVALLEYLIKTYTKERDLVLDNTMGSGSTGIAAVNLNRGFIGMEKDPKYFEIAEQRIQEALANKNISVLTEGEVHD